MKDLRNANTVIASISSEFPDITPITEADYPLFQSFFDKEEHTYGNSWTYITQGMYGIGPNKLGYKYYDGKNLSAICAYPRIEHPDTCAMYWIRPMGPKIIDIISDISKKINKKYKLPVYGKKLFKKQYDNLIKNGFKNINTLPWHKLYPSEDDVFPEQIIDVQNTLDIAKKSSKMTSIHRALRYYESIKKSNNISHSSIYNNESDTKHIIDTFFSKPLKKVCKNLSDPFDYYALLHKYSKKMLEKIFYINKKPTGFFVIEQHNDEYASLYATLSLRTMSNHIVDYMMFDLIHELANKNVRFLNLGGSETESLHAFKQKFQPKRQIKMHWSVKV
jgi:hypothetical protein